MELAEERLLDLLLPSRKKGKYREDTEGEKILAKREENATREKLRMMLKNHKLDERMVELKITNRGLPIVEIFSASGFEEMDINLREMVNNIFPKKAKNRKVKIPEALEILTQEEAQKLIDMDKVISLAIKRTEQSGIIFLDEIDKIASREKGYGPDVSREGVQRDLLPIVEGSTVLTK